MTKTVDDETFMAAVNRGLSTNALAKKFGITPDEAYERAIRCMQMPEFIPKHTPPHPSCVNDEVLLDLICSGMTPRQAAEVFGVSLATIHYRLRMIARESLR